MPVPCKVPFELVEFEIIFNLFNIFKMRLTTSPLIINSFNILDLPLLKKQKKERRKTSHMAVNFACCNDNAMISLGA